MLRTLENPGMPMSRKNLLATVLLALSCGVASAHQAKHFEIYYEAGVSIGADGKISTLTVVKPEATGIQNFVNRDATDHLIDKRLEPLIRNWTFEPGSVNGQPMATETTLHVELEAVERADGNYSVTLLGADTGPRSLVTTPPDYPKHEINTDAEAKVILLVSIDATGAPIDITAANVITNGPAMSKTHFANAAIDAAKHWRFLPETVGGHPVATQMDIPITFCLDASNQCPSIAKRLAAEDGATPANRPVALDSKVKLLTQVAGTTF
jgi:TonB family protein